MEAGQVLIVVLIVVLGIGGVVWTFGRSASMIEQWARENGYKLIDSSYAWLYRGPFFWTSSRNQTVYRVTVRDEQGRVRRGWVRCGSWWTGLLSDRVEVRWDE